MLFRKGGGDRAYEIPSLSRGAGRLVVVSGLLRAGFDRGSWGIESGLWELRTATVCLAAAA
jgi:hypothetical protein